MIGPIIAVRKQVVVIVCESSTGMDAGGLMNAKKGGTDDYVV